MCTSHIPPPETIESRWDSGRRTGGRTERTVRGFRSNDKVQFRDSSDEHSPEYERLVRRSLLLHCVGEDRESHPSERIVVRCSKSPSGGRRKAHDSACLPPKSFVSRRFIIEGSRRRYPAPGPDISYSRECPGDAIRRQSVTPWPSSTSSSHSHISIDCQVSQSIQFNVPSLPVNHNEPTSRHSR